MKTSPLLTLVSWIQLFSFASLWRFVHYELFQPRVAVRTKLGLSDITTISQECGQTPENNHQIMACSFHGHFKTDATVDAFVPHVE